MAQQPLPSSRKFTHPLSLKVHKETTTSLFSSIATRPNYHSLCDFIFSIDHPPVILSSPSTMFGHRGQITTQGTDFGGCPDPNSSCGFIGWYDEPMCARSKVIIPGLLRTINKLRKAVNDIKEQASKHEKAMKKIKEQAIMLKYYLVYSWIFFVVVLLFLLIGALKLHGIKLQHQKTEVGFHFHLGQKHQFDSQSPKSHSSEVGFLHPFEVSFLHPSEVH
uniref:Zinc finger, GRF-type n=1 Tax=Lactuca sativa TaxID=4236 RepID=A0A9R1WQX8_LACSA|nr:hypothetical protein LSAT_V11C100030350 [Lactuca sativa]